MFTWDQQAQAVIGSKALTVAPDWVSMTPSGKYCIVSGTTAYNPTFTSSRTLLNGSQHSDLALGATESETIRKVVLPAALPGVVGGILLAVSRAIGETMIVVMAACLAANLTANPSESVTTVTVQIVQLLTGDQEFDSAKTLAAFALGLVLFLITLVLNLIALTVVRRYREAYE